MIGTAIAIAAALQKPLEDIPVCEVTVRSVLVAEVSHEVRVSGGKLVKVVDRSVRVTPQDVSFTVNGVSMSSGESERYSPAGNFYYPAVKTSADVEYSNAEISRMLRSKTFKLVHYYILRGSSGVMSPESGRMSSKPMDPYDNPSCISGSKVSTYSGNGVTLSLSL